MIIIQLVQHDISYRLIFFNFNIHAIAYCPLTYHSIDCVYDSMFWCLHSVKIDDVILMLQDNTDYIERSK